MAARGENDKTAPSDTVSGGQLVLELIGDGCLRPLLLRKFVWIAADPILRADLHRARRKKLLKALQSNLPCGEGVVRHQRRPFGVGYGQVGLLQSLAIERAEV